MPFRHAGDSNSIGSGFFIDDKGTIVTNAHVCGDAIRVWITIPEQGEKRYKCSVVGICFDSDLAVLRADDAPVTKFLRFGDSNRVRFGDSALALGYPLGMKSLKLTLGVISGRQGSLLQVSTPLNPGSSGSPLLNAAGAVIGVNVAIVSKSQNVGFAIPSYVFLKLQKQLMASTTVIVTQPTMGADFQPCSDEMLEFIGASRPGVLVNSVVEEFPLHVAGLREGDILHVFDGLQLDNFGETPVEWSQSRASISDLASLLTVSDRPVIEFSRTGEQHSATLELEDPDNPGMPKQPIVRSLYPSYERIDFECLFGLCLMPLAINHIEALGSSAEVSSSVLQFLLPIATTSAEQNKKQLIVSSVLSGSTFDRLQILTSGALVKQVNGQDVNDLQTFRTAFMKPVNRNGTLYFTVKTKGNEFVALPIAATLLEDLELSSVYHYSTSSLIQELLPQLPDDMQQRVHSAALSPASQPSFAGSSLIPPEILEALMAGYTSSDEMSSSPSITPASSSSDIVSALDPQ
jgi:S1-C subfamily serine protease